MSISPYTRFNTIYYFHVRTREMNTFVRTRKKNVCFCPVVQMLYLCCCLFVFFGEFTFWIISIHKTCKLAASDKKTEFVCFNEYVVRVNKIHTHTRQQTKNKFLWWLTNFDILVGCLFICGPYQRTHQHWMKCSILFMIRLTLRKMCSTIVSISAECEYVIDTKIRTILDTHNIFSHSLQPNELNTTFKLNRMLTASSSCSREKPFTLDLNYTHIYVHTHIEAIAL